jgi:hypothetical protein
LFLKIIVRSGYLRIKKNLKNRSSLVLLFLGDLKNRSGLGFRNPKKGGYEMRPRVRVCD